jgi:hypothetical protein
VIAYGWQKSSYSAEAGSCVELRWQKSSYSGDSSNCLETGWQQSSCCQEGSSCLNIAAAPGHATLLRESDDPATVLATTPARLAALLGAVKTGRLSP